MKGLFITFEGNDGAGKSTQLRFLAEYLREKGYEVVTTREPGGCPLSEQIREMLLDVANTGMDARTEALLYAAARAQHVKEVIAPAVDAGKIVLCDRFVHSSVAYQGYGRALGAQSVHVLSEFACAGYMPDHTFFLKISAAKAFERMNENKKHDRLENEEIAFHERVYEGFLKTAESDPRVIMIDVTNTTKYETSDIIKAKADEILAQKGL